MAGLKVGSVVRCNNSEITDLTYGRTYKLNGVFGSNFEIFDDRLQYRLFRIDSIGLDFLGEAEPQPDVHALIANLGRRLLEVETALAPKESAEVGVQAQGADKPAQIREVCDKVRDLLIRKNHDYGDSFAQQYAKYGLQSALIRMDDKMRRLETLADGEQAQVAESIEDTLMDLAGYALLALVEASE